MTQISHYFNNFIRSIILQNNWNTNNKVAYYGGKYSTWHRWLVNHYADDSIKHKGHHDHFEKMLGKVDAKYENIDLLYWKRKHH